jgi:hypothetical protein
MFKTSHLGVSNFGFLSLCPFRTENANFTQLQNYTILQNDAVLVLELGVKLTFRYDFFTEIDKVRENQILIYLSEKF